MICGKRGKVRGRLSPSPASDENRTSKGLCPREQAPREHPRRAYATQRHSRCHLSYRHRWALLERDARSRPGRLLLVAMTSQAMATSRAAARERTEQDLAAGKPTSPLPLASRFSFLSAISFWEQGTARAPGRSLRSEHAASRLRAGGIDPQCYDAVDAVDAPVGQVWASHHGLHPANSGHRRYCPKAAVQMFCVYAMCSTNDPQIFPL